MKGADRDRVRTRASERDTMAGLELEDDEPVDHKPMEEEKCKPKCQTFVAAYEACVERIAGDETGEAHCTGQYFDMYKCIDDCAAKAVMANTA